MHAENLALGYTFLHAGSCDYHPGIGIRILGNDAVWHESAETGTNIRSDGGISKWAPVSYCRKTPLGKGERGMNEYELAA